MTREKKQTFFLGVLLICICILIGTSVSGSSYEYEKAEKGQEIEGQIKESAEDTPAAAFTFEGGPGVYTERLLNALEKEQVTATFFLDLDTMSDYPGLLSRMNELDCTMGLWVKKEEGSAEGDIFSVQEKLEQGKEQVAKLQGKEPQLLRVEESGQLTDLLSEPFSRIGWSVDGEKEESSNVSKMVEHLLTQIKDGDIIRLNDTHETAVTAAEIVIPQLKKKGFRLLTVEQLAKEKGIELQKGQTYQVLKKQKNQ